MNNCPYCDKEIEINHENNYGFCETEIYQQECDFCGKTFVFTTQISYDHTTDKADCLNGGVHQLRKRVGNPYYPNREVCFVCGFESLGEKR